MKISSKLNELKRTDLNCNVFDVYSYNDLSMQELLCQFFTKINECIKVSNETIDLATWLVNEGLAIEVVNKLMLWLDDGTLENLINVNLFNTLHSKIENINTQLAHIEKAIDYITPEMFGCVGDGVVDDSNALQNAINYCRENNKVLMLFDKLYYVTKSINIGNVKIRSFSNIAGQCDMLFLKNKNGGYLNNTPDWSYYFNTNNTLTWRDIIDNCAYGCAIISDKNINILTVKENEKINLEGVAIIGNHREKNQNGICDEVPTKYNGNNHNIKNVNVLGCGNNGINLYRGFETSVVENVNCSKNNGYGLYIGQFDGIDCATEYLTFNNCSFSDNRLSGVYFSYWRKHITFNNCHFNGNGQYYQNVKIDPILGYDRTKPTNVKQAHSGIWFNKGNDVDNISQNLTIKDCYGENLLKGVHIQNIEGTGALNNVIIENNTFYRGDVNSDIGVCFYINVNYLSNFSLKGTIASGLKNIIFEKEYNDGGQIQILDLVGESYKDIYYKNGIVSSQNIISKKRLYSNNVLFRNKKGGNNTKLELTEIQNDFNIKCGANEALSTAMYILSASWGGTNAQYFGSYVLLVTRVPDSSYVMAVIPSSSVKGFVNPPKLTNNGVLQIDTEQYYVYTLTRVDNVNTLQ